MHSFNTWQVMKNDSSLQMLNPQIKQASIDLKKSLQIQQRHQLSKDLQQQMNEKFAYALS
jgi:hypothetical protein